MAAAVSPAWTITMMTRHQHGAVHAALSVKMSKRTSSSKIFAVTTTNTNTNTNSRLEREKLKEIFQQAYERCWTSPMEGVSFTIHDFHSALYKYDFNSDIGTKVKGTVYDVDGNGALVDITAKSLAFLPVREASIHQIKHVAEAGIHIGMQEEFMIIGQKEADDSLILSIRVFQYELAWERCRELFTEDAVVKGKVVGATKSGLLAVVEGLRGFIPFSHLSTRSRAEELIEKEIPLKILEVDEEKHNLVLSNRKAIAASQTHLGIGSVVVGTVQRIKEYGVFIDIGGKNGLLHISQISHDRVDDITTVFQPGDTLKVMILNRDREKDHVSLSTKKLEPSPGDMIRNPKLVFDKAEEMAQIFRQRIAQAEAMARADILRFQPESGLTLNSDGILGPFGNELPP